MAHLARFGSIVVIASLLAGCASAPPPSASRSPIEQGETETERESGHGHGHGHGHGQNEHRHGPTVASIDERLAEVARIHGGAGPWAVAGYRMGEHALKELGLERGSFDLVVTHFSPKEVQYACIADGAAADGYRMSSFILAVVKSDAFRMQRAEVPTEATTTSSH